MRLVIGLLVVFFVLEGCIGKNRLSALEEDGPGQRATKPSEDRVLGDSSKKETPKNGVDLQFHFMTCDEGKEQAKNDIKNGQMGCYLYGLRLGSDYYGKILSENGIKLYSRGCTVDSGYICYNNLMKPYIKKRLGSDFFEKVLIRIDSLKQLGYQEASYPNGERALFEYIDSAFRYFYPDTTGRVLVSFTLDTTGNPKEIRIDEGISPEINHKCSLIIANMPKWIPARNQGKKIKKRVILPIQIAFNKKDSY